MIPGVTSWNGNRNPVTLVSTVVIKKIAVQPLSVLRLSSPKTTMNHVPIPAKLNRTCISVKVDVDIPRIMLPPPFCQKM
jgi:hypothetical protein